MFEEVVGYKHLEELKEILSRIIISRGRTYDVEYHYESCDLTDEEKEEYGKAARDLLDGATGDKQMSARLHDLQRIADGSHHKMEHGVLYSKNRLLIQVLYKILSKGEGCLIYTEYEDTYNKLADVIKKYHGMLRYRHLMFITGKTSYKERVNVEKSLGPRDIVILTKAGCRSINLQAVNNVVVYDIPFSIGDLLQLVLS